MKGFDCSYENFCVRKVNSLEKHEVKGCQSAQLTVMNFIAGGDVDD